MRKSTMVAMVVIVAVAMVVLLVGQFALRRSMGGGAVDVAAVLDGTVTSGSVTLRGLVDDVDFDEGCIYLKDLKLDEVCRDSVCFRAVIRVVTAARPRVGERTIVKGRIVDSEGSPYLIAE